MKWGNTVNSRSFILSFRSVLFFLRNLSFFFFFFFHMWRSSAALSASIKVSRSLCNFVFRPLFLNLFEFSRGCVNATPREVRARSTPRFHFPRFSQIYLRPSPLLEALPVGACRFRAPMRSWPATRRAGKLYTARSRLCRSQILQVKIRWEALALLIFSKVCCFCSYLLLDFAQNCRNFMIFRN